MTMQAHRKGLDPECFSREGLLEGILLDPRLKESVVQGRKPSLMGMLEGRSSMHRSKCLVLRFPTLLEYPGLDSVPFREKSSRIGSQKVVF